MQYSTKLLNSMDQWELRFKKFIEEYHLMKKLG